MGATAIAIPYVVFVWWFSTGAVLALAEQQLARWGIADDARGEQQEPKDYGPSTRRRRCLRLLPEVCRHVLISH